MCTSYAQLENFTYVIQCLLTSRYSNISTYTSACLDKGCLDFVNRQVAMHAGCYCVFRVTWIAEMWSFAAQRSEHGNQLF